MFSIRYTNTYSIRANGQIRHTGGDFKRVNHAIRFLKQQRWPSVLAFRDPKYKRLRTLMAWEGMPQQFARNALRGVTLIGPMFYIPNGLLRKTSRRRTRK